MTKRSTPPEAPAEKEPARARIRLTLLPVELNRDEVIARAKVMSGLVAEQRTTKVRLEIHTKAAKSTKEQLEGEIEALASRIGELATAVRNGREDREVEVYDAPDFKNGTMLTLRADTDELVSSRGMTEAERQRSLFVEAGTPAAAAPEAQAETKA